MGCRQRDAFQARKGIIGLGLAFFARTRGSCPSEPPGRATLQLCSFSCISTGSPGSPAAQGYSGCYHVFGLWIEVPGMGSGNWELANAPLRMRFTKSGYLISSLEGCPPRHDKPYHLAVVFLHEFQRLGQVAVIRDNYRTVEFIKPGVIQKVNREVDIGALFLGPDNIHESLIAGRSCQRG
jgi:hypothetical protein